MSFLISHVRDATGIFFHYSYNCCDFITIFEILYNEEDNKLRFVGMIE